MSVAVAMEKDEDYVERLAQRRISLVRQNSEGEQRYSSLLTGVRNAEQEKGSRDFVDEV